MSASEISPDPVAETCGACGAPLSGVYCSECGQKRAAPITFAGVLNEGLGQISSLDSKLAQTVVGLTRAPGRVCREYVDGRRIVYLNPAKYLFFTASLFALVVTFLGVLPPGVPADQPEQVRYFRMVLGGIAYTSFASLLVAAAFQRMLFRRDRFHIAEIYVFQLYLFGHYMLLAAIIVLCGFYSSAVGQVLIRGVGAVYFLWGIGSFYERKKIGVYLKGLGIYLFHTILTIIVGVALILSMR